MAKSGDCTGSTVEFNRYLFSDGLTDRSKLRFRQSFLEFLNIKLDTRSPIKLTPSVIHKFLIL